MCFGSFFQNVGTQLCFRIIFLIRSDKPTLLWIQFSRLHIVLTNSLSVRGALFCPSTVDVSDLPPLVWTSECWAKFQKDGQPHLYPHWKKVCQIFASFLFCRLLSFVSRNFVIAFVVVVVFRHTCLTLSDGEEGSRISNILDGAFFSSLCFFVVYLLKVVYI